MCRRTHTRTRRRVTASTSSTPRSARRCRSQRRTSTASRCAVPCWLLAVASAVCCVRAILHARGSERRPVAAPCAACHALCGHEVRVLAWQQTERLRGVSCTRACTHACRPATGARPRSAPTCCATTGSWAGTWQRCLTGSCCRGQSWTVTGSGTRCRPRSPQVCGCMLWHMLLCAWLCATHHNPARALHSTAQARSGRPRPTRRGPPRWPQRRRPAATRSRRRPSSAATTSRRWWRPSRTR
jgi:hypothetical protein